MNKETAAKPTITKNALSKAVTEKVAAKKTTTKKVDTKAAAKKLAPNKAVSKKVAAKKKAVTAIEPQLRDEMITTKAYFRAKERNFEPGHAVADWLESEKQIDRMLINE